MFYVTLALKNTSMEICFFGLVMSTHTKGTEVRSTICINAFVAIALFLYKFIKRLFFEEN